MKYLDESSRQKNASTSTLVSTSAHKMEGSNNSNNSSMNYKNRSDSTADSDRTGFTLPSSTSSNSISTLNDYDDSSSLDCDSANLHRDHHEAGVKSQYDVQEKLAFYKEVMGDGTGNIHFGKWDGVDAEEHGAYGKASEQMTDYMYDLARSVQSKNKVEDMDIEDTTAISNSNNPMPMTTTTTTGQEPTVRMVDLGSGTGSAARRLAEANPNLHCTCLNLCEKQNAMNQEQTKEMGLHERVHVHTGTYESAPVLANGSFDIVFSQDALIHSFSKTNAYLEAKRVARPGGVLIFSDLMAGEDASLEELDSFASTNMVKDWLTPSQNVACLQEVGFRQVTWIDMTADIQKSFAGMLRKVDGLLATTHDGIDKALLETYKKNLSKRIDQCDRNIFSWGVIHACKPVKIAIYKSLPVPFLPKTDLLEFYQGEADDTTDAIVVDFTTRCDHELVQKLPSQVSLIVTLSSGKDHIACDSASSKNIFVASSDKGCITKSVAEYGLSLVIAGLRNIPGNIGVPFPGKAWTLSWNCQGVSLDQATIGILGMGDIASLLVTKLRALSSSLRIVYYEPEQFRNKDFEAEMNMEYRDSPLEVAKEDLDMLMPLAPLFPSTQGMVSAELLASLPTKCGLVNISRGPIVDQDALVQALKDKKIQYAILDATTPEPLPEGHELLSLDNAFILPHFATNTLEVREQLVSGIETIVNDFYDLA